MNNPFPCETRIEGVPCTGHATHVYRSASATRLICDSCATAYRFAAKGPRRTAIVEFTLLEFIPAREFLMGQVETMRAERDQALQTAKDATALAKGFDKGRDKAMTEAQEAWNRLDKVQQNLARAVVLSRLHQEGEALTQRWVLWADATAVSLAVVAQVIWGGMAGWYVFAGGIFLAYWVVSFTVQRWWVRPRLAQLNETEAGIQ